jgi:hypothetical protein
VVAIDPTEEFRMKSRLQRSFLAIAAIVMAWTIGLSGFATVAGAPL